MGIEEGPKRIDRNAPEMQAQMGPRTFDTFPVSLLVPGKKLKITKVERSGVMGPATYTPVAEGVIPQGWSPAKKGERFTFQGFDSNNITQIWEMKLMGKEYQFQTASGSIYRLEVE